MAARRGGQQRDAATGRYKLKFTPAIAAQICDVIRAGNYIETAAAYAGVHRDTFYDWLKRGRDAVAKPPAKRTVLEKQLVAFVVDVEQALATAEVEDLAVIGKAAEKIWQASAWRLERRMPHKYALRNRVELAADGDSEITIKLAFGGEDGGD